MAIATPQILATVGSSVIFKMMQKPRGVPGDRSIGVVLAVGGLFGLVAAGLTARIRDEVEVGDEGGGGIEEGRGENGREERERMLVRGGGIGEY